MLTIGMIGGMSWESSAIYYGMINEAVREGLGGHHSAQTQMYSVGFPEIKRLQHEGRWEERAASLAQAARKVEKGGADFLVLCTNTMHRMADAITEAVSNPLLHIADATAEEIKARGIQKVGLLVHAVHDGAGLLQREVRSGARHSRQKADRRRT